MAEPKTAHELKLLKAVKNGLIHKTRLLLSLHSIQVNDERYFDYHLLIKALDNCHTKLARLLIEKGFRVFKNSKSNKERTVLHAVIQSEDLELLRRLLAGGASPDILTFDEQDKTPFHLAIDNDYTHTIDIFLMYFDAKTLDKNFLLHYAVGNNHVDVVSQLISRGFSLKNKFGKNNVTPFCVALMYCNYKLLKVLLSNYGAKDIKISCHNDIAPAYIASLCGDLKLIERYIECGLCINSPLKLSSDTWSCFRDCSGYTLLHFAVKNIQLKMTEFLLSAGADISAQNENESSPLHLAFETKEIGIWQDWQDFYTNDSIIDLLLEANTKFHSNTINKNGLSHFHIACCRDKPAIVEHFLKLGALLNEPVGSNCLLYKKFSPLHFAAKFRCKKTLNLLLNNGVDVEQKDFQNMTALHIAAKESCLNIVDLLLQYGADVTSVDSLGNTPLHLAFENKNYEIIDRLLSVPNLTKSNSTNIKGISHFHIACTRNNVNVVKSFIEKRKEIVDTCIPAKLGEHSNSKTADWSNYSPLHFAVSHNRAKIVNLLLHSGANVGLKNGRGRTPFHLACEYTFEMFEEFIESILCDLSKHKKNVIRVNQPLSDVTKIGNLTEKNEKFMGCVETIDWSLHRQSYLKILNLLLDFGSDVNCIDNEGHAPLFHVYTSIDKVESILKSNLTCSHALTTQIVEIASKELRERRKLVINSLLELGANMDKCYSNRSILHFGVSNYYQDVKKNHEILELFLKKGAYVDAEYEFEDGTTWTPLTRAVSEYTCSIVDLLLKYNANVDYIIDPKNKLTPLLLASKMPLAIKIFDSLIVKSKNVNARLSDGSTALHNVASTNMKLGLENLGSNLTMAGADFNIQDSRGRTALHLACERYRHDFVVLMLENWADINIEDNDGRSVCCCFNEFRTVKLSVVDKLMVVDLLQSHIIKLSVIGLPCSAKTLTSISNCIDAIFEDRLPYDYDKMVLQVECEAEVKILKETEIHGNCSLYDVIFKDENTLSHLVKNPAFEIVKSETFVKKFHIYGNLVSLKYQTGLNRKNLLPRAKCVLDDLAGRHLPDSCSENIYKYFTNIELRELTERLAGIFESKMNNSDCIQLRNRVVTKRQKVD